MNTPTAAPPPKNLDDSSRIRLDRFTEMISQNSMAGSKTWELDATPHIKNIDNLSLPSLPKIPGLTFVKEICRGGMGSVYQACQESLNRNVAVKLIHGGSLAGEEERYRFRLEAEVAARIKHPNIVQVYEAGMHQGRAYLVMEWVEGGTLQQWQNGKPIEPRLAAELVAALADGIQAAHSMGVLHRDLKPANVLLSAESSVLSPELRTTSLSTQDSALRTNDSALSTLRVKVSDFGMAKRLHEAGVTQSGYAVGTPHYMAPEQARGDEDIGTGADIYSLGAILYELLTGRPPFQGSAHIVLYQVINDDPASPLKWKPDLPQDVVSICQKCMRKDAKLRYHSAAELAVDLRRFLDRLPVQARPISVTQRFVLWARRRPAIAGLILTLLLTMIISYAGMTWLFLRAEEQRSEAVLAKAQMERKELATRELNRFFLRDFFNQASPDKQKDKKLLFSDALSKIAQDFETDPALAGLRKFPELIAGTRLQLGSTLMHQGKLALATQMLEGAFEWYQANRPEDDEERLHCFNNLLNLLLEQGQLQKVEPLMRDLVAMKVKKFGPYEHPTIASKSNLVGVLYEQGKMDEALTIAREMLDGLRRTRPAGNDEMLHTFSNYTFLLFKAGKVQEAERLQRECLAECQKHLTATHPHTILVMNNLASSLRSLKRPAEAEPLMKQVAATSKQVNGPAHPETLSYQGNYAGLLRDLGRLDEAQKLLEDAWRAAQEKKLKHPVVLKLLDGLASLAAQRGKLEPATVYAQELLQAVQTQLDAKHQMQAMARSTYGHVLLLKKDHVQAVKMLEEAVRLAEPHGAALAGIRSQAIQDLVAGYEALGKASEAEAIKAKWGRKQ
ncbi:MAG: serine/threonine-protein kinase [Gemmatales bacterium]